MALDLAPPNYGALASLAGNNNAHLNLPVPGALGLQALQLMQTQKAQQQQAVLEQMRLAQQGQMAQQQQDYQNRQLTQQGLLGQSDLAFKQQQAGIQNSLDQTKNDLMSQQLQQTGNFQQGDLDVRNKQLALEQSQLDMTKLLSDTKQSLQQKGAFATYAKMAMDNAKTPEEAQQIRTAVLNEALSNGFVSENEAKAASQMPISQFKNSLDYKIMQYGVVKDYKDMKDAEKTNNNQTSFSVGPDGSIQYTQAPTSTTESKVQKDLLDREEALKQLGPIREEFNKQYFTYPGQIGLGASKFAEKTQGIPGVGWLADKAAQTLTGGKSEEDRAAYIQNATAYLNKVEQFFQQKYRQPITGAAAAESELKDLRKQFLSGDMSPSEFQGSLDAILQNYTSDAEFKKNVLNKGIDVTPQDNGLQNYLKSKGYSDSEINDYLKGK